MSGFFAWVGPPELPHQPSVTALLRGRDGQVASRAFEGGCLYQVLEAQVPESIGVSECSTLAEAGLCLAFEGRLDNREELAEALSLPRDACSWPDQDYVLRAYAKWGADGFLRLLGDYAFALRDESAARTHVVRDAMGTVPLYYAQTPRGVAFSTCLNAVLACPGARWSLDREHLLNFLTLHFREQRRTFYNEVKRLPAGHRLVIEGGRVSEHRYFELMLPAELNLGDNEEYSERFAELLEQATRCRLRAPSDPGFLLSGGLDSSSLVGIGLQHGLGTADRPLKTFSGLFPDYPHIDERPWIDKVLAQGCFAPEFRRMDKLGPLAGLERDIAAQGQPFYSPNNYVDRTLLDAAEQAGMHILIDGLDGDTTVGHGWELLGEWFREGRWRRMWRMARELARHTDRGAGYFLWRHALMPTWFGWRARLLGAQRVPLPPLLKKTSATWADYGDQIRQRRNDAMGMLLCSFREQHYEKLSGGLLPMSFEIAYEQGQARGITRRHPYFDRRLVEFCLSLPAEQRLARGADRMVQRRAVGRWVPEDIRRRLTKSIWEQNFRDRVATDDRALLEAVPERYGEALDRFIDGDRLVHCVSRALARRAPPNELAEIWIAACLGTWLHVVPLG